MNATSTRPVVVEAGGTQVVGHVGLHALGSFADRLGVGESLSEAVGWAGSGRPVHDRGRVLTQTMLMLAGGGESCADIEALASQGRLFGAVCSDTTYTDQAGDPVESDRQMRAHAHVEDHIARLKDSGLVRFPFTRFEPDQAWLQTGMWAADLVSWFQLLCPVGPLARARPKPLRWTFWHAPARIVTSARRDIVRILNGWPTAGDIVAAYRAIAALT